MCIKHPFFKSQALKLQKITNCLKAIHYYLNKIKPCVSQFSIYLFVCFRALKRINVSDNNKIMYMKKPVNLFKKFLSGQKTVLSKMY